MKLRQLQYLIEVARNGLNVTAAAEKLFTSQPGVSKQIRLIEEELGIQVFSRNGKHLTEITPAGKKVLVYVERALTEVENIRRTAENCKDPARGSLSIATTHTQARYALPRVIKQFRERYPNVTLNVHQGSPTQIAEMTTTGQTDLAIATEALDLFHDLVLLPCYRWNRCVLVQPGHPLLDDTTLTLEAIARYPLITYVFGFAGRSKINKAFHDKGLQPNVVLTALDADVIKEYVRVGLGVGLVAGMAFIENEDTQLRSIDASHLFDSSITSIAYRINSVMRGYTYEFIRLFAPHLTREVVDRAMTARSPQYRQQLFDEHVVSLGTK